MRHLTLSLPVYSPKNKAPWTPKKGPSDTFKYAGHTKG